MPQLKDEFRNLASNKQSMSNYLLLLQTNQINPLTWKTDEVIALTNEFLHLFYIDDDLSTERMNFCAQFCHFLEQIIIDINKPFENLIKNTRHCFNLLELQEQRLNKPKRAQSIDEPPAKRQRLIKPNDTKPNNETVLSSLGYNHSQIASLNKEPNPLHASILIKWHPYFSSKFSHQQLVTITLLGGEQAFLFLTQCKEILQQYNFNADEIIRMFLGGEQAYIRKRFESNLGHLEVLFQKGFSKQQVFLILQSGFDLNNISHINEQLYQFSLDDVTQLIIQSPPEIFILINQYLEYFIELLYTPELLLQFVKHGDTATIYWILNNYSSLVASATLNPDIADYDENNPVEVIQNPDRDDLSSLETLQNLGFAAHEAQALLRQWEATNDIHSFLTTLNTLTNLGFSPHQIKQIIENTKHDLFQCVLGVIPDLIQSGYPHENIINFVKRGHLFALKNAAKYTPELKNSGYTIAHLILFFDRCCFNAVSNVEALISNTPTLQEHGLTLSQIINLASHLRAEGLNLLVTHFATIYQQYKNNFSETSHEQILKNLTIKLSLFSGLRLIKQIIALSAGSLVEERPPLFPKLLKQQLFYCSPLKSYIFIFRTSPKSLRYYTYSINNELKILGFSEKIKSFKKHFALCIAEMAWSKIWPNLPPPTDEITQDDLQDYALDPENYYRIEGHEIAAYISCHTVAAALLCASHLNYMSGIIQNNNKNDEPLPEFKASVIGTSVCIDNYGAYHDSISCDYSARAATLPNNVDDLPLRSSDRAHDVDFVSNPDNEPLNSKNDLAPISRPMADSKMAQSSQNAEPLANERELNEYLRTFGLFSQTNEYGETQGFEDNLSSDGNKYS